MFNSFEKIVEAITKAIVAWWSSVELISGNSTPLQWAGVLIVAAIVGVSSYTFILGKRQERRLKKRADDRVQELHELDVEERRSKLNLDDSNDQNVQVEK